MAGSWAYRSPEPPEHRWHGGAAEPGETWRGVSGPFFPVLLVLHAGSPSPMAPSARLLHSGPGHISSLSTILEGTLCLLGCQSQSSFDPQTHANLSCVFLSCAFYIWSIIFFLL